jgi:hypothetical protein
MTIAPLRLYGIGAVAAAAIGAGLLYSWLRSRQKSPEQRERERRERIAAIGRITDGTILDACELEPAESEPPENAIAAQLLIFNYDVAGVTYEASQDVTYLRQFIDLHHCRLGVPASVKYDPQNPGNSIVISESWSGLRKWSGQPQPAPEAGPALAASAAPSGATH